MGEAQFHHDRSGRVFEFEYDRAKRLTKEISPKTTVTVVKQDDQGKLSYEDRARKNH